MSHGMLTFIDLNGDGGMVVKISFEGLLGWNGHVPSLRDEADGNLGHFYLFRLAGLQYLPFSLFLGA